MGQSFVAPASGKLTSIDLWITRNDNISLPPDGSLPDLQVFLTGTDANGAPALTNTLGANVISPGQIPSGRTTSDRVSFTPQFGSLTDIEVERGQTYALVAAVNDPTTYYQWNSYSGNPATTNIPGFGLRRERDDQNNPVWVVEDGTFDNDAGIEVRFDPDLPDLDSVPDTITFTADALTNGLDLDASAATHEDPNTPLQTYDWQLPSGLSLSAGPDSVQIATISNSLIDNTDPDLIAGPETSATLTLEVTDVAGYSSSKPVTVTYQNSAPEITAARIEERTDGIDTVVDFYLAADDPDFALEDVITAADFENLSISFGFRSGSGSGALVYPDLLDDLMLDNTIVASDNASDPDVLTGPFFSATMNDLRASLGAGTWLAEITATDSNGLSDTFFEPFLLVIPEASADSVPVAGAFPLLLIGGMALSVSRRRACKEISLTRG